MSIRIVIVDDHELLREGIKAVLSRETDLEVVGEAADGRTALQRCRELHPDLLLLDMRLPDMSGIEVCERLQAELPQIHVLVLTAYDDPDLVLAAVRVGVKGYIIKDVLGMDLRRDIRAIVRGEVVMDTKVVGHLMQQMRNAREKAPEHLPLNKQQLNIVRLVARGHTNREIADQLYLSEKTVKGYLAEALRRLNVKNRVEAAMVASKQGWI